LRHPDARASSLPPLSSGRSPHNSAVPSPSVPTSPSLSAPVAPSASSRRPPLRRLWCPLPPVAAVCFPSFRLLPSFPCPRLRWALRDSNPEPVCDAKAAVGRQESPWAALSVGAQGLEGLEGRTPGPFPLLSSPLRFRLRLAPPPPPPSLSPSLPPPPGPCPSLPQGQPPAGTHPQVHGTALYSLDRLEGEKPLGTGFLGKSPAQGSRFGAVVLR
jgi:hypothetical protein